MRPGARPLPCRLCADERRDRRPGRSFRPESSWKRDVRRAWRPTAAANAIAAGGGRRGADTVAFLSSAQSLRAAEPIPQPDGQFPAADVRFATLLHASDSPGEDAERQAFSQRLLREDRLAYLDPGLLIDGKPTLTI